MNTKIIYRFLDSRYAPVFAIFLVIIGLGLRCRQTYNRLVELANRVGIVEIVERTPENIAEAARNSALDPSEEKDIKSDSYVLIKLSDNKIYRASYHNSRPEVKQLWIPGKKLKLHWYGTWELV